MDKNLITRLVFGFIYALIVFLGTTGYASNIIFRMTGFLIQPSYFYYALITFFALVGFYECLRISKIKSYVWLAVGIIGAIFIYYHFSRRYFLQYFYLGLHSMDLLSILLFVMGVVILFRYSDELRWDQGKAIFSVVYVVIPFGFALGLPDFIPNTLFFSKEVFIIFILIWSSDSFAYIGGRLFGKRKFAPKISPNKTWEGYFGGVLLTILLGVVLQVYFPSQKANWIILSFLIAIFAPLGDLIESQLKRKFGVKDSGNIIPGHGGVLDRLDSFILCSPIVYLYFMLINF